MLVTRARMSTLFALVKTHNYLIYISFPPQKSEAIMCPRTRLSLPSISSSRRLQSSSNQLPSCALGREKKGSHESGSGGWTETDGEKAHGSWDVQAGSASRGGFFLGKEVSAEARRTVGADRSGFIWTAPGAAVKETHHVVYAAECQGYVCTDWSLVVV